MLLNDLKGNGKYCIWKKKVLGGTMWITRFERGYGPVAKQTGHRIYMYYSFVPNFQRCAICRHETEDVIRPRCCYFTVHNNFDFNSSYTLLQYAFTKCCFRALRLAMVTPTLQDLPSTMWKVTTNITGATSNDLNIVPHFVNISHKQRRRSILMYPDYTIFLGRNMPKIYRCVK